MNRLRQPPPLPATRRELAQRAALAPLGAVNEATRYLAVSCVALGGDVATLAVLVAIGVNPVVATALGYLVGLAVHYALATRFVFRNRRYAASRGVEASLYATTGLAGLVLSAAIVAAGGAWGFPLAVSKSIAVAVSFVAVYVIRRAMLFNHAPARKSPGA